METPSKYFYKINASDFINCKSNEVNFSKPRIVAYYERKWESVAPAKSIKYFIEPSMSQYPIDLNAGNNEYCKTSNYCKHIGLSLKYAMSAKPGKVGFNHDVTNTNIERTKVFTRQGTILHLMESIFWKNYKIFTILVTRYNGNIYMTTQEAYNPTDEFESPVELHHNQLKRYLFAEAPNVLPKTSEPWNENIEFLCVHHSNFGKYDLIYSGVVQGIISKNEFKDFDDMVRLNDCRFVLTKQIWAYSKWKENKFLNYWLQAYLSNVEDIYLAYKVKKGVVERPLRHIIASELPKKCYWEPSSCFAVLYDFLQRVENLMSDVNCLNTVYAFEIKQNTNDIHYQIFEGKTDKTFITKEYMEYCYNECI